jgi:DNA-binding winged helix-turn-helix (wHTH) protein
VSSSQVPAETVRFGEFKANLRTRELWRLGSPVRLADQSFRFLALLLEHPGELVTRQEIRDRLWPDDTFVDFDHGLNNAVNRLREALVDSADAPRFIETLPRRGYRFIGATNGTPLANLASAPADEIEMEELGHEGIRDVPGHKSESPAWRKYRWLLWTLPLLLLLLTFVALKLPQHPVAPSSRSFVLPPEGTTFNLTGDDGGSVVLSPDGSKLAFVAVNARGDAQIWVRPLGSLSAEVVEGSEGATFPFWSPDGESLGFFAGGKLKKISRRGGTPVVLCDAPFGRGGSWNRNGVIIFAPASHTAIYRVADSGGIAKAITTVNTALHTTHRWPKFLPDGTHFLYIAATHAVAGPNGRSGSHNGIYLASLDGSGNKFLIAADADATFASGYLFFLQGDTLMAQAFDARRGELLRQARPTVEKVLYDSSIWKVVFDASDNGVMAYETGDYVSGMQYEWYDRAGNQISALSTAGTTWNLTYHEMAGN